MIMSKEKRKQMQEIALKTYELIDPSGINKANLESKFNAMSDEQFDRYMKKFLYDDEMNFKLCITPYKNDLRIENIKKALDYLGVPMFEKVSMPYLNPGGEVYQSQDPCPVGYLIIKRPQQMVSKKNSMSINVERRSSTTGQVTADDKNGRVSDMENIALTTLNSKALMKEFLSARSDDMVAKNEVLKQIKNDGYVDMSKIETKPRNKVALNTMDVYFTAAGIKTNLITDGLLLPRTMDNKKSSVGSINQKYERRD